MLTVVGAVLCLAAAMGFAFGVDALKGKFWPTILGGLAMLGVFNAIALYFF